MNVVNGYDQMISDENAHVIFDVADPYLINKIDPLFRSRRIKYMPEATVDNARSLVRREMPLYGSTKRKTVTPPNSTIALCADTASPLAGGASVAVIV